eukprot:GHVN01074063.1.p1 GENE.GHVN01074063.1~~GHVN01074063.1.p1  ORF type:complete len:131 (-),score=20.66 GHVN01074063.1:27-419(-)
MMQESQTLISSRNPKTTSLNRYQSSKPSQNQPHSLMTYSMIAASIGTKNVSLSSLVSLELSCSTSSCSSLNLAMKPTCLAWLGVSSNVCSAPTVVLSLYTAILLKLVSDSVFDEVCCWCRSNKKTNFSAQ